MDNLKLLSTPFAQNGLKNNIPNDDIGLTEGLATYEQGFPEITMTPLENGGIPPSGYDVNGVLNDLSSHIVHLNTGGQYKFDVELCNAINGYSKGAILLSDDESKQYISLVNNNKVNFNTATPAQISGKWDIFNDKVNGSITAGNGLVSTVENKNTTLSLGTPATITGNSTNNVTASGHTHEVAKATTGQAGIVQLYDGLSGTYQNRALTALQGKVLNDKITTLENKSILNNNSVIKFDNNHIIQIGRATTIADNRFAVTKQTEIFFPVSFTNKCYGLKIFTVSNKDNISYGINTEIHGNRFLINYTFDSGTGFSNEFEIEVFYYAFGY